MTRLQHADPGDVPLQRLPEHIRRALSTQAGYEAGEGPEPSTLEVEALIDLTSWSFNGVRADHPDFERRFTAWSERVTERHRQRLAELEGRSGD